jgi:hypothetical protein
VTDLIYKNTTKITQYKLRPSIPDVDLSKEGSYKFRDSFRVEVFDCVEDHLGLLKQVFDFGPIRQLFARKDFTFCYDSMHGVQGPYAKRIFVQEFRAPASALINCDPKEDFGGELFAHRGLTSCRSAALLPLNIVQLLAVAACPTIYSDAHDQVRESPRIPASPRARFPTVSLLTSPGALLPQQAQTLPRMGTPTPT